MDDAARQRLMIAVIAFNATVIGWMMTVGASGLMGWTLALLVPSIVAAVAYGVASMMG